MYTEPLAKQRGRVARDAHALLGFGSDVISCRVYRAMTSVGLGLLVEAEEGKAAKEAEQAVQTFKAIHAAKESQEPKETEESKPPLFHKPISFQRLCNMMPPNGYFLTSIGPSAPIAKSSSVKKHTK